MTPLVPLLLALAAPPGEVPPSDADRAACEALKDIHDRGADLYNAGDPAGAYRLYQGALLAARPLLGHRPAAQKLIDDGLADAGKAAGAAKAQAFHLHAAIEAVRAELKTNLPRPVAAAKEAVPAPRDGWVRPAGGPAVRGRVTLDGKPVGGVEVSFVPADRVDFPFVGATADDGTFYVAKSVPAGNYAIAFRPAEAGRVPAKYATASGSGVKVKVVEGENKFEFDLKSK